MEGSKPKRFKPYYIECVVNSLKLRKPPYSIETIKIQKIIKNIIQREKEKKNKYYSINQATGFSYMK